MEHSSKNLTYDLYVSITAKAELSVVFGFEPLVMNWSAARQLKLRGQVEIYSEPFKDDAGHYEEIQLEYMPALLACGIREMDVDPHAAERLTDKTGWIVSRFALDTSARLVNYPRSGSTWLRLMLTYVYVWEWERGRLHAEKLNGVAGTKELIRWSDYIVPHLYSPEARSRVDGPFPKFVPRLFRTHRSTHTTRHPQVIYLVRDGCDVMASFYKLLKKRGHPPIPDSLAQFIAEGAGIPAGGWRTHVKEWLSDHETRDSKSHPALLLTKYEDFVDDPTTELTRVCQFLDLNVPQTVIEQAVLLSHIDVVRSIWHARVESGFVGKGEVGGWINAFDDKATQEFFNRAAAAWAVAGYGKKIYNA